MTVPAMHPGEPVGPARVAPAALRLLRTAYWGLQEAAATTAAAERYATAHLAALRAAAAVLAARARPARARPINAWELLARIAPELGEWATFFAAGAGKRAAAQAGLPGVVTAREADDLLRDVELFIAAVAQALGVPHQPVLESEP